MSRLVPADDLRHPPAPGQRGRDSVFYQLTLPDERLALQVYVFVSGMGTAGCNVVVWDASADAATPPLAIVQHLERGVTADLDDLRVGPVHLRHEQPLRTARVSVEHPDIALDLAFEALHDAFSYHDNPDGLPAWMAVDRLEQSGWMRGVLRLGDREIPLDAPGHRDHSWGVRDWRAPQHWKWFAAYTPSGRALNGWIWIARGEWGVAGYVLRGGRAVPAATIDAHTDYDAAMQQRGFRATLVDLEGVATELAMDVLGIVHLPDERGGAHLLEASALATIDGEPGAGQLEIEWPFDYYRHLVEG